MSPNLQVIDETGALHTLTRRIGVGGQGEVWLTAGGRRIVKLLNRGKNAEAMRRQFAFVRRLDLHGLHVARPIAVLRPPHVGYVAEFLDDMVPIKALIEAPAQGLLQWHIDTGGLRRRLRLLAHAGEALLSLHARGVVYADVSHNNIFVSEPVEAQEAWLIDLDNLSHDSDPHRTIHTPGYGAPELLARTHGCTSLSDAWAFAVLVWQTLTLTHPLIGDLVNDGEPELEEEAFAGRLPWVLHSTDDRNACSTGLPPELVLASRLVELARKTFEHGLEDRPARTSVSEWVERLHAAADQTVGCAGCSGTFFVTESACPWCDEPRGGVVPVRIERWDPKRGLQRGAMRLGQLPLAGGPLELTRRQTEGLAGIAGREAHLRLERVSRGVAVHAAAGREAWLVPIGGDLDASHHLHGRPRTIPQNGWMVLFEDPALPQRAAVIGASR